MAVSLSRASLTPYDEQFPTHAFDRIQRPQPTDLDGDTIIALQALQPQAEVPLLVAAQSQLLPILGAMYLPLIALGGDRFVAFLCQNSAIRLR